MIIAHDLGTSGNKASLHDQDGRLLASVSVDYPTHYGQDTSEQDPHRWWRAVVEATNGLLAASRVDPASIRGLCVSGQMMAAVLLDAGGQPLRPAMIWSDQRAGAQADVLIEEVGEDEAYRLTGHRIAPTYTLPKAMWVRDNEPEVWAATRAVCVAKDFVNLRLTGRLVTDHSDASSTDAYDLEAGSWSTTMLDAADLDGALWPEIVASTEVIGTLCAEAARALGLPQRVLVIAGGGDGPMASVGAGCIDPSSPGYVCLGTSAWFATTSAAPVLDPQRRSFTFRHVLGHQFTPCATTQSGAGSLQWLLEAVGDPGETVADLVRAATGAQAAAEGLFFLPYLLGERSPWWNADASGAFVGLRRHHGKPHLARAVLEGVGYNLALCIDPLKMTAGGIGIDVIGGGAVSDSWLQLLADLWGEPVRRRSVTSEANSLGAAVVGLVGLGLAEPALARELSRVEAEFTPGEAVMNSRHRQRFEAAYRSLAPWFTA